MKHIKLFDKKDSLVQDIITNPSADYPIIALCQDVDDLSFCDTPIVKAKIDITSDEDVSNYIKSDYNIKSLTIDGELKFKKDTWVKYEHQLTQDDFQYTDDFGGTYVFSKYNIYVKLNSGCRNVYLTSNENATQFMLIRPHYYGGYGYQYISHEFVNIDEMKESLFIKQIDDYTYDLTNFYLYYDKTDDRYGADNLVGIFLADDNGNILTQNLSFECFDVNVGHDPKIHQVTKENALNADINFGPKVSISGQIDINDYILVGFTQNGRLMFGEPLSIQYLIDNGFGSLSNNTFDLDLTALVGGSSEFSSVGFIYAIVDKSIEGESIEEITEITEFVKDGTITYYETIIYLPILSVGEHELEVELLQQQYMPFFNNHLLISLDMRHINGEYINTESMCYMSYKLQKVYLPHNLKNIGANSLQNCYQLTSVIIPDSVTEIGYSAFRDCYNLTSVTILDGVTSIGYCAFQNCTSLTSVTIPNSVTSIGNYAFENCSNLTSVTIGSGVTYIGNEAFRNCTSLTSVTILDGVTSIGSSAFTYCINLTSVTIPDSVTYIGSDAFKNCTSLTSIEIPSSVTSIDSRAFQNCTSLSSVTIPDSVTNIGNYAFENCSNLTSVTIGSGVTSIGNAAFRGCTSLTSVTIPDSVTEIGNAAFRGCTSLTSVAIPDSVTSISNSAFYNCTSLTSVTIPDSVTSIAGFAFYDCGSLTSVTIPNSVTSIGDDAFYGCGSLTSITIPSNVTEIGNAAFYRCSGLKSITIPSGVTSIGTYTFYYCESLNSITCLATTAPTLSSLVFHNLPTNGKLYVSSGSDYSSWLSSLPSGWTIEYI